MEKDNSTPSETSLETIRQKWIDEQCFDAMPGSGDEKNLSFVKANRDAFSKRFRQERQGIYRSIENDESIQVLVESMWEVNDGKDTVSGRGVAVATNRRIFFLDKNRPGNDDIVVADLSRITSAFHMDGLVSGTTSLAFEGGSSAKLDAVKPRKGARAFSEFVNNYLANGAAGLNVNWGLAEFLLREGMEPTDFGLGFESDTQDDHRIRADSQWYLAIPHGWTGAMYAAERMILRENLKPTEEIGHVIGGGVEIHDEKRRTYSKEGVAIATDLRILLISKDGPRGKSLLELPYSDLRAAFLIVSELYGEACSSK